MERRIPHDRHSTFCRTEEERRLVRFAGPENPDRPEAQPRIEQMSDEPALNAETPEKFTASVGGKAQRSLEHADKLSSAQRKQLEDLHKRLNNVKDAVPQNRAPSAGPDAQNAPELKETRGQTWEKMAALVAPVLGHQYANLRRQMEGGGNWKALGAMLDRETRDMAKVSLGMTDESLKAVEPQSDWETKQFVDLVVRTARLQERAVATQVTSTLAEAPVRPLPGEPAAPAEPQEPQAPLQPNESLPPVQPVESIPPAATEQPAAPSESPEPQAEQVAETSERIDIDAEVARLIADFNKTDKTDADRQILQGNLMMAGAKVEGDTALDQIIASGKAEAISPKEKGMNAIVGFAYMLMGTLEKLGGNKEKTERSSERKNRSPDQIREELKKLIEEGDPEKTKEAVKNLAQPHIDSFIDLAKKEGLESQKTKDAKDTLHAVLIAVHGIDTQTGVALYEHVLTALGDADLTITTDAAYSMFDVTKSTPSAKPASAPADVTPAPEAPPSKQPAAPAETVDARGLTPEELRTVKDRWKELHANFLFTYDEGDSPFDIQTKVVDYGAPTKDYVDVRFEPGAKKWQAKLTSETNWHDANDRSLQELTADAKPWSSLRNSQKKMGEFNAFYEKLKAWNNR